MKVDFEIDTVQLRAEEIRKSLSMYNDPSAIAVKLMLIQDSVNNTSDIQRVFNKISIENE
jgi:4-hydroxy-L-threonine phosphate dehydrogenase PdxA